MHLNCLKTFGSAGQTGQMLHVMFRALKESVRRLPLFPSITLSVRSLNCMFHCFSFIFRIPKTFMSMEPTPFAEGCRLFLTLCRPMMHLHILLKHCNLPPTPPQWGIFIHMTVLRFSFGCMLPPPPPPAVYWQNTT